MFKSAVREDVSTIHREILRPAQPVYSAPKPEESFSVQAPAPVNRSAMIKESLDFGKAGMLDMIQDMEDFDLPTVTYQLPRPPSAVAKPTSEFGRRTANPQSRYQETPVYASEEVKAPSGRGTSSTDWQSSSEVRNPPQVSQSRQPEVAQPKRQEVQPRQPEASQPRQPEVSASTKPRVPSSRGGYNPRAYQETPAVVESSWSDRKVELGKPMFEGKCYSEQAIASVKQAQPAKSAWDDWDS
jgi:hypothetical protein